MSAPGPDEIEQAADELRAAIPDAAGEHLRSERCLYTNTPDLHFLVDRHPTEPRVIVVSACSGHGFKFATVVGELVTDLAAGSEPAFDLAPFRCDRLGHDPVTTAGAPFTHDT